MWSVTTKKSRKSWWVKFFYCFFSSRNDTLGCGQSSIPAPWRQRRLGWPCTGMPRAPHIQRLDGWVHKYQWLIRNGWSVWLGDSCPLHATLVLGPDLGLTALETPFFTVLRAALVVETVTQPQHLLWEEALSDSPMDNGQFLRDSLHGVSSLRNPIRSERSLVSKEVWQKEFDVSRESSHSFITLQFIRQFHT